MAQYARNEQMCARRVSMVGERVIWAGCSAYQLIRNPVGASPNRRCPLRVRQLQARSPSGPAHTHVSTLTRRYAELSLTVLTWATYAAMQSGQT